MGSGHLDLTLSRTAYQHPDGNAFIERMFRTLKEEAIWTNEFDSPEEPLLVNVGGPIVRSASAVAQRAGPF